MHRLVAVAVEDAGDVAFAADAARVLVLNFGAALLQLRLQSFARGALRGAEAAEARDADVVALLQRRDDGSVLRVEERVDHRTDLAPCHPRALRNILDELALVHARSLPFGG